MYADKAEVAEGEEKKIWAIKLQIENGYQSISASDGRARRTQDYGGQWSPALKQWLSISVEALPKLLQTVYDHGYPLTGNFNFDGSAGTFLSSHGAYIKDNKYKWSLHQIVMSAGEE
eukprot:2625419-Rhodomonas_salina.1